MKEEFTIKINHREILYRMLTEIFGIALFAIGVHSFIAYNNIVPGGITGIATMVNYVLEVPIGVTSFLLNFPLLFIGFYCIGKKTVLRTLITVFLLSFALDVGIAWMPIYNGNLIGASVMGGSLMGCGLSFILKSRTTTGGGDLLGKLIQMKYPKVSMGKILITIDGMVIAISAFVYGEVKYALCGILAMGISSVIVDWLYRPCIGFTGKGYADTVN